MFNRKKIVDERIVNIQNKIYREIGQMILILCSMSIIIKVTIGLRGFEYIWIELIIIIFAGIYYIVRSTQKGIFSEEVEIQRVNLKINPDTLTVLIGITLGVIIGLIFGFNSAIQYADGLVQKVYYFMITFTVSILMYVPFLLIILYVLPRIAKNKSDQINRKMLDEMDEE